MFIIMYSIKTFGFFASRVYQWNSLKKRSNGGYKWASLKRGGGGYQWDSLTKRQVGGGYQWNNLKKRSDGLTPEEISTKEEEKKSASQQEPNYTAGSSYSKKLYQWNSL